MAYRWQAQGWWQSSSNSFPAHLGQSVLFYTAVLSLGCTDQSQLGNLGNSGSQSVTPGPVAPASPGSLLELRVLIHPSPAQPESERPRWWGQVNLIKLGVRAIVLKSGVHQPVPPSPDLIGLGVTWVCF